jgi:hypothetical protein
VEYYLALSHGFMHLVDKEDFQNVRWWWRQKECKQQKDEIELLSLYT